MIKNIKLYLLVLVAIVACVALYERYFWQPPVHKIAVRFHHISHPIGLGRYQAQPRDPWDDLHFPMTIAEALTHGNMELALRPDQRFLEAFSLIAAFPKAPTEKPAHIEFKNGKWWINADGAAPGALPTYPDFTDAMRLLRVEAKQRFAAQSSACDVRPADDSAAAVNSFDDRSLIKALDSLDQHFQPGTLSGVDLWAAGQALARLAFLDDDSVTRTDRLAAKAMAVVAMAETLCGKSMPEEESLLAAHLGYGAAAAQAVAQLPASDPWRLYFTNQDQKLRQLASPHPGVSPASYFWLRRLADLDRKQDWQSWYDKSYGGQLPSVYILVTMLRFSGFGSIESYIDQLPQVLLPQMQGTYSPTLDQEDVASAPIQLIRDFNEAAQHLKVKPSGPYLTAPDTLAYYRGYLYAGFYKEGYYLLELQDDEQAASQYRNALQNAPDDIGSDLYRWADVELKFKHDGLPLGQVMQDMAASKELLPSVYHNVWAQAAARLNWGSLQDRQAVKQLGTLYDTRPESRENYATALRANMFLSQYAAARTSLAAQENPRAPHFRIWLDYFNGDNDDLLRIASDPAVDRDERGYAVGYATTAGVSNEKIRSDYENLISEYPDNVDTCERFLGHLRDTKDYVDMEREARFCLTHLPKDYSGLARDDYVVYIASAQVHQGKKNQAWNTISTVLYADSEDQNSIGPRQREVGNYYANVLGEATYIALARGNYGLAESLARALAKRYPDDVGDQKNLLRVLWTEKRYQDAADILVDYKYPLMYWNWTSVIGKTFAEVFKNDPVGARAAFKALQHPQGRANGIGDGPLTFIASAVDENGNPGLAFDLRQMNPTPVTPGAFPDEITDYEYLKNAKGAAIAIPWLIKHSAPPGPQDAERREWLFYTDNLAELLWSPLADPKSAANPEQVWLYRAAAYVQGLSTTPKEVAQLKTHFNKDNPDWQGIIGGYLMGRVSDQEMMNHAFNASQLFEAIYFVALRQLANGNYQQAQRLLNLEMDTAKSADWQYLSSALLLYWRSDQSLQVLSRKGALYKAKDSN